jgi:hypothetical protein
MSSSNDIRANLTPYYYSVFFGSTYYPGSPPYCARAFLGHRSLQHTRKYVQLERALFHSTDDSFVSKVASTADKATELIELGFDYVNEINGRHLYRKKK